VLSPATVGLDEDMLDRLHRFCLTYSPASDHQYRESDKRFSMNDRGNFFAEPWKAVMKQLLDPQHPFVHVIEEICAEFDPSKKRFYLHMLGGDTVCPGGPGQTYHSDWWGWEGGYDIPSNLACSIYTSQHHPEQACLEIVPKSWCREAPQIDSPIASNTKAVSVCPAKGSILIRDVNVWHRGSANMTADTRVLPAFLLLHREHLTNWNWRPHKFISDNQFAEHYPEPYMQERMCYLWQA